MKINNIILQVAMSLALPSVALCAQWSSVTPQLGTAGVQDYIRAYDQSLVDGGSDGQTRINFSGISTECLSGVAEWTDLNLKMDALLPGSTSEVLFNNGGILGADSGFTYSSPGVLTVADEYRVSNLTPSLKFDETDGAYGAYISLSSGNIRFSQITSGFGWTVKTPVYINLDAPNDAWIFEQDGDIDIAGAVKLGPTTDLVAGAIQWTGSDFEGYTGTSWSSLTSGGAGSYTWLGLTDTPASYTAGYYVVVNAGGTGLELTAPPAGTGDMTKLIYDTDDDGKADVSEALTADTASNTVITLGDNAGATHISVVNSDGVEVATIDSDGVISGKSFASLASDGDHYTLYANTSACPTLTASEEGAKCHRNDTGLDYVWSGSAWAATSDDVETFTNKTMAASSNNFTGVPYDFCMAISDNTSDMTVGVSPRSFRVPRAVTVTGIRAQVSTAPVGSTITIDVLEDGVSILSTPITIDDGEDTSTTAAVPPVVSDNSIADDAEMTYNITQVGSTTAGIGGIICVNGTISY